MEEWRDFIAASASLWTILQMLSPIPTCYYFIRKQNVGDMVVTPYVVALTSCTLWLLYGIEIHDSNVTKVNMVGACLQLCYVICYYVYCNKKAQVRQYLILGFCVILSAEMYSNLENNTVRLISNFGLLCSCVTVLFFASPLANMRYVIKVWNSESLPRLLIAATFIVSLQWTLYGYIIDDIYILVTNLLGTLLSTFQLALVFIIPRESNPKVSFNV